jgi:hypothetical protein
MYHIHNTHHVIEHKKLHRNSMCVCMCAGVPYAMMHACVRLATRARTYPSDMHRDAMHVLTQSDE